MKKLLLALLLCSTLELSALGMGDRAMITVCVVEETGAPVPNAKVHINFFDKQKHRGLTDTNGLFAASGNPPYHEISYGVEKEGYYYHWDEYAFSWTYNPKNKCEPWNPTNTVVLKRVKNPVSMFVKRVRTGIPVENHSVGFDLERGDWVAPYGHGLRPDMEFVLERNVISEDKFECSLQVMFPNEGDGLQEITSEPVSERSLRLPYSAPQAGYSSEWEREISMSPDGSRKNLETRKDQNYMFRVQTVLDENNEVKSALYGKIHGDINVYGYITDKVTLGFTYYLNPTPNDRNVEFDPDKNLFGGRDNFAP